MCDSDMMECVWQCAVVTISGRGCRDKSKERIKAGTLRRGRLDKSKMEFDRHGSPPPEPESDDAALPSGSSSLSIISVPAASGLVACFILKAMGKCCATVLAGTSVSISWESVGADSRSALTTVMGTLVKSFLSVQLWRQQSSERNVNLDLPMRFSLNTRIEISGNSFSLNKCRLYGHV